MTDEELAARIGAGAHRDEQGCCYRVLLDRYKSEVFRVAFKRLQPNYHDALNASQNTWMKIWAALRHRQFDVTRQFRSYLFGVTGNEITNIQRGNSRWRGTSLDNPGSGDEGRGLDPEDHRWTFGIDLLLYDEQNQNARRVLDQLRSEYRDALIERHLDGCTPREMAERKDVEVRKVRDLLHRARVAFRRKWEQEGLPWPDIR